MKEFINKLIERLEYYISHTNEDSEAHYAYKKCKEEVNQLAEEYNQTIDVAELVEKFGQENGRGNDGCEWNRNYQFISDKYKVETGCGYTFYDLHHAEPFAHCPYCGKENFTLSAERRVA